MSHEACNRCAALQAELHQQRLEKGVSQILGATHFQQPKSALRTPNPRLEMSAKSASHLIRLNLGTHPLENDRLRRQVHRLQVRLDLARRYAATVAGQAQQVMAAGNLPRARWSFIKGSRITAAEVYKLLSR